MGKPLVPAEKGFLLHFPDRKLNVIQFDHLNSITDISIVPFSLPTFPFLSKMAKLEGKKNLLEEEFTLPGGGMEGERGP